MRALKKFNLKYFLFDQFSLIISYFSLGLIRRGGILTNDDYINFIILLTIYFVITIFLGLYKIFSFNSYLDLANILTTRFIFVLSAISIIFVFIINESFSRFIIINALIVCLLLSLIFLSLLFNVNLNGKILEVKGRSNKLILLKIFNITIFIILCYFNCDKKNTILVNNFLVPFLVLLSYLIINNLEHKFILDKNYKNFWFLQWSHIKVNILFASSLITILLLFYDKELLIFSKFIINISLLGLIDFIFISIFHFNNISEKKYDIVKNKLFKANAYIEKEDNGHLNKNKYSISDNFSYYLPQSLSEIYLKNYKSLFEFLDDKINLYNFDIRKSIIIRSSDTYNIEVIPKNSIEFYSNLHELNNFRRLNEYFIKVNEALVNGGVFVGNFEPASLRIIKFNSKYSKYLSHLFYFFDFIWKRIFPKIPFLKYFYFEITKGRNRVFSISEVFGRLHYCGFKIHAFEQIEEKIFFIAIKNGKKITEQQPTYGPLIKLRRVGKNGEEIWVYKFRTMSPYSEFLQEYVFENFNLKKGGKFENDFRITKWGKFLRKLWLDELPMLINLFRGELKIVGVRPISFHYFSLYPEEFRQKRIKYKPGLIPPFYYDLPKTLYEIIESEKRYLELYDKRPILTDIKYFLGAFKNIIFKRARSC